MSKVLRTIMCILLPLAFLFSGIIKLYPVFPSIYKQMEKQFAIYNAVFPTAWFGYPPDPTLYRIFVGSMETACALGVLLGPTGLKKISCCILIVIMVGAVFTHLFSLEFFPALVPLLYMSWTMYVLYSVMQREAKDIKKD